MKDIDPFQFIVFGTQKDGDSEVKYNVLGPDGVVYEGGTSYAAHSMAFRIRGGYIQHKWRDVCAFYLEAISRGAMHDDKVLREARQLSNIEDDKALIDRFLAGTASASDCALLSRLATWLSPKGVNRYYELNNSDKI